ncbi:hypothetical protein [Nonomuraea jabiensis]|uniref:Uncharacterized protein n=1 Tax=Nonomuraea jabiensis TaxID=882448 RepID=A0A7W9G2Z2_9ACTN|nr:hypothetical protein [Nonomuraea jabiensis]MBB5776243.1 hypothetical protein [Nonomuraea jabiensis]
MGHRTAHLTTAAEAVADALAALARRDGQQGTAEALRAGHAAVKAIDEALRALHEARSALVGELVAEQNRLI